MHLIIIIILPSFVHPRFLIERAEQSFQPRAEAIGWGPAWKSGKNAAQEREGTAASIRSMMMMMVIIITIIIKSADIMLQKLYI